MEQVEVGTHMDWELSKKFINVISHLDNTKRVRTYRTDFVPKETDVLQDSTLGPVLFNIL